MAKSQYTLNKREEQLKLMHAILMLSNNEDLYMSWIHIVPDCPCDEDFKSIAEDDENYNEVFNLFNALSSNKTMRY